MAMSTDGQACTWKRACWSTPPKWPATVTVASVRWRGTRRVQLNEPVLIESWSDYVTCSVASIRSSRRRLRPQRPHPVPRGAESIANLPRSRRTRRLGDGRYTGPAFDAGEYVKLQDASKAHYLLPAMATNRRRR